ncbi:hypothetical protein M4I32_11165 [Microbacterium sp. LRZ72]|uniref:hypothetical protein n=1 Tax=Microbacterium sp. LRZ72 TaxID=2942481 RepID=UPI0029B38371|nr:hypothetical protein [Microbacterium sp. LRZ72]MDX2377358.1 hypothetical protein [Microbacterium sp. LRZ72]
MTDSPSPAPRRVSSTPIFAAILRWGALVTLGLVVVAGAVGYLVSGVEGLFSALAGVVLAAVFLAITAISILIANRWFGDPLYVPIFFGIVLGGWLIKLVFFIVLMLVVRGAPWLEPPVFFVALVAAIVAALTVDVVVLAKMRLPYVSDVSLPGDDDERGRATGADS